MHELYYEVDDVYENVHKNETLLKVSVRKIIHSEEELLIPVTYRYLYHTIKELLEEKQEEFKQFNTIQMRYYEGNIQVYENGIGTFFQAEKLLEDLKRRNETFEKDVFNSL